MPQAEAPGCGAVALLVVGLLILVPSGLCTAVMAGSPESLGAGLIIGGPFVLLGAWLVYSGASKLKKTGSAPPDGSEPPGQGEP